MDVREYILSGLETALTLERELGTQVVECDRAILTTPSPIVKTGYSTNRIAVVRTDQYDYVYLHHSPLSERGKSMMDAIISKLGKTQETTPIIVEPPLPKAKLYVVLGGRAMNKFFPSIKGAPGQWIDSERGEKLLITYSPEYILRFTVITPAVQKIKESLWCSLKLIAQKQGGNK